MACPVMAAETGVADHLPGVAWGTGMRARVSPAPAKQTSVNIQHLQLLQAQWLRTLSCTPKPCRHPARPRQILVAALVAAEGCHVLVEQGVSLLCCCVCTFLQTGTEQGNMCPWPQRWVLCRAMQGSQGVCHADTCSWRNRWAVGRCIMQNKCRLESALCICCCGNTSEVLIVVILLGVVLVSIPLSWIQLLLWLKLHQAQRKRKIIQ